MSLISGVDLFQCSLVLSLYFFVKSKEVEVEDLCVHSATCLSLPASKNALDTDSSSLNAFETYTNVQFHKVAIIVKKYKHTNGRY